MTLTRYDHFKRLLVMISFIIVGLVITALASIIIALMSGMSMADLQNLQQNGMSDLTPTATRFLLLAQHLFSFILPGVAFALLFYGKKWMYGLDMSTSPGWLGALLGILFMLASYPLVNLSFMVNEVIPMPSWAIDLENQAEETLKTLLQMESPLLFLFNLLIIAILPGIGEELIFRGIVQKELGGILRSQVAAIWIAAFLFSAIHLQFEGFFPRMVLGVVLGYLYYWSKNLWVPIIAHAFNNGMQIVLIYATGMDLSEVDETGSENLQWWMMPLSILAMYWLYTVLLKNRKPVEDVGTG